MSSAFGFQLVVLSWFGLIFGQFWVNRRFSLAFITGFLAVAVNVLAAGLVADVSHDLWAEVQVHSFAVVVAGIFFVAVFTLCRRLGWTDYDPNYRLWGGKRSEKPAGAELEDISDKKD